MWITVEELWQRLFPKFSLLMTLPKILTYFLETCYMTLNKERNVFSWSLLFVEEEWKVNLSVKKEDEGLKRWLSGWTTCSASVKTGVQIWRTCLKAEQAWSFLSFQLLGLSGKRPQACWPPRRDRVGEFSVQRDLPRYMRWKARHTCTHIFICMSMHSHTYLWHIDM